MRDPTAAEPDPTPVDGASEAPAYRLTTAEIVYGGSHAGEQTATFVWQDYDHLPDFPRLRRFLDFWRDRVGEELYSVTVTHVSPREEPCWRFGPGSHAIN